MKYNPQKGAKINSFIFLTLLVTPPLIPLISAWPLGVYLAGNLLFGKIRSKLTEGYYADPNHSNEVFLNSVYQNIYNKKYMNDKISTILKEVEKAYPSSLEASKIKDTKFLIDTYVSMSMEYLGKYIFDLVDKWISLSPFTTASNEAKAFARNNTTRLTDKINALPLEQKEMYLSVLSICEQEMQRDGVPTKFLALDNNQIDKEGSYSCVLRTMKDYRLTETDREYFKSSLTYSPINSGVLSKIVHKLKLIFAPSHLNPLALIYNSALEKPFNSKDNKDSPRTVLLDTSYLENLLKHNSKEDNDLILAYLAKVHTSLSQPAIELYSPLKSISDDKNNLEKLLPQSTSEINEGSFTQKALKSKGQKI